MASPNAYSPIAIIPNPTAGGARIRYSISTAGLTRIRVLDATGRRVRSLMTTPRQPGEHEIRWDGTDERGRAVAPGVYFVVVDHDEVRTAAKLLIAS